jgi:carboxylate-amine ligase
VRYGTGGTLIDYGKEADVAFQQLTDEILELVDDVLDDLGTREEVGRIATIAREGTSADRQIATFDKYRDDGATEQEAMYAVVDQLITETRQGWDS